MDNVMTILSKFGKLVYVAFFLVVHLMKLHSISLIWGVAQEAMEYEEQAKIREMKTRDMILMQRYRKANGNIGGMVMVGGGGARQPTAAAARGVRLKRLAFIGFGGTLGGFIGSVFVSFTASTLRLSGLLVVAAILLLLSAELSSELGQIMLRHWNEGNKEEEDNNKRNLNHHAHHNTENESVSLDPSNAVNSESSFSTTSGASQSLHGMSVTTVTSNSTDAWGIDSSLKKVASMGSMKRVASCNSMSSIRRARSACANLNTIDSAEKARCKFNNGKEDSIDSSLKKVISLRSMKRVASVNSIGVPRTRSDGTNLSKIDSGKMTCSDSCCDEEDSDSMANQDQNVDVEQEVNDNSFKQRLLRGIKTIIQSRLLMTIFTYNALYATTTVLLSFQRAELVANRSTSNSNNDVVSDAAFLAKINIASSAAVFALQASGMGAFIATSCGQRGTLSLMPIVRLLGLALLAIWHVKADGVPPNLTLFLILDEFTKVINFSVAKPVRERLWSDLSNEARYEAKPIVDTLANRWGGGSAAFLMALLDKIMHFTGLGEVAVDGTKTLFGFPPLLFLCSISALWWSFVSVDLGNIRRQIDAELKKQE